MVQGVCSPKPLHCAECLKYLVSKIAQMMFHTVCCPLERNYFQVNLVKCIQQRFLQFAMTVLICELSLLLLKSELRCQSEEVVLLMFLAEIQWKNFMKSVGLESDLASCMKTE